MAAIDNKHLLEILNVVVQSGTSKKSGNPFTLHKAQCVFHGGADGMQIGQLILAPKIAEVTKPGKYLAEFELGVNFNLEVVPRITALHPWKGEVPKNQAA